MSPPKYIDLSGYSFVGKSAYNNLISEFSGFYTHDFDMEFDLVRTKDGISDLFAALVDNWSPVRSSEAIRNFQNLIASYHGHASLWDRLSTTGRHYDMRFPGFTQASHKFIKGLIDESWVGEWPYAFERCNKVAIIIRKLLFLLGYKRVFETKVYLASPTERAFIMQAQEYLDEILYLNVPEGYSSVVMNNVLEPFNPTTSMQFFSDIKSIVLDRDPRDIYLAAWSYTNKDGSKGWRSTLGKDVQDFVRRFLLYRRNIKVVENPDILRLTFEELVLDYENTLEKIFLFLDVDSVIHTEKKKYFDPDVSVKGVGAWRRSERQEDIDYIYQNLKDYCRG